MVLDQPESRIFTAGIIIHIDPFCFNGQSHFPHTIRKRERRRRRIWFTIALTSCIALLKDWTTVAGRNFYLPKYSSEGSFQSPVHHRQPFTTSHICKAISLRNADPADTRTCNHELGFQASLPVFIARPEGHLWPCGYNA